MVLKSVGYHKKESPKQEPKKSLRPCKYRSQETTTGKPPPYPRPGWTTRPTSNNIRAHPKRARPRTKPRGLGRGTGFPTRSRPRATRPRMRYRFSDSPKAPRHKASDEVPILRLARGPVPRGLGRAPNYQIAGGRLGINPVTAALTDFSDRTSHSTNASNHSRDISRTAARYSGAADKMGVISTLCHLTQDEAGVTGCFARHCAHG